MGLHIPNCAHLITSLQLLVEGIIGMVTCNFLPHGKDSFHIEQYCTLVFTSKPSLLGPSIEVPKRNQRFAICTEMMNLCQTTSYHTQKCI